MAKSCTVFFWQLNSSQLVDDKSNASGRSWLGIPCSPNVVITNARRSAPNILTVDMSMN